MIDIDSLKQQHAGISVAMNLSMAAIDGGQTTTDPWAISESLGSLSTCIHDHLKVEDEDVYPVLMDSGNAEVKRTATRFQTNMGGLAEEFESYFERYRSPDQISGDPALFNYETRRIFELLRHRMRREEKDLYPLLERA
jgi:hypothetical protein